MRATLIFLAGLLVGANAVYFLMTWGDADPNAVLVLERERTQHADLPAVVEPDVSTTTAEPANEPSLEPIPPTAAGTDVPPLTPPLSTAPVPKSTTSGSRPSLIVPVRGMGVAQLSNTFDDARGQGRVHEAIDIMAARGTPVLAVADGKVEKLFTSDAGGLTIYHFGPSRRYAYYYAHLDRYAPGLVEGKTLKQGEVIGYVGSTGNASEDAPHLHFSIFALGPDKRWWEGTAINPYPVLTGKQPL